MRQEIAEVPEAVERVVDDSAALAEVAAAIRDARPSFAVIAGRGTSDHAAIYAQYVLETHVGIPSGLAKPSVTTVYDARVALRGGLVLAISQSGQSPDIVAVIRMAREAGALTVAITNDTGSPLAEAAAWRLDCHAGPELAVPATKTYVAELAVVAGLVAAIGGSNELARGLAALPDALRATIDLTDRWLDGPGSATVDDLAATDRALVVSRGYNLATAFELALKLKETVGIFADAYSTADFAHGPRVLARHDVPIVAIRPDGPMGSLVDATLDGVAAHGGRVTLIGGPESAGRDDALAMPAAVPEALTPLQYIVPGQLVVEATARRRGMDPDAPAGLGKVTLTR